MKPSRQILATLVAAALAGASWGQTPPPPPAPPAAVQDADVKYVKRVDSRFRSFAGSGANLESLAAGLRHGSEITLNGSGESVSFTPPTRPMGYGNVTRALDLANRQLADAGIIDPSPQEIRAALTGGTVSTPTGSLTLEGVLQLRSQGMGWGQIAHAVGVHPGLGAAKAAPAISPSGSGVTTALGTTLSQPGNRTRHNPKAAREPSNGGIVTSAAGAAHSPAAVGARMPNGHGDGIGRGGGKR